MKGIRRGVGAPSLKINSNRIQKDPEIPGFPGGFREVGKRGPFPGGEYTPIKRDRTGFWQNPPVKLPPWIAVRQVLAEKDVHRISPDERLHYEIHKFVGMFKLQPDELRSREEVVDRWERCISEILPGSRLIVFGSTVTRLATPISNINLNLDIPVLDRTEVIDALKAILDILKKRDFLTNGYVIGSSRLPVLRAVDDRSRLTIDLSVGDGFIEKKTANLMTSWGYKFVGLPHLYMVVKYALMMRGLAGNANEGGLGAFPLLCWIVAWVQSTWLPSAGVNPRGDGVQLPHRGMEVQKEIEEAPMDEPKSKLYSLDQLPSNLGGALLSLLHFMGNFNTRAKAIDLLNKDIIVPKELLPVTRQRPETPYELTILPVLPEQRKMSSPYTRPNESSVAHSCSGILSVQLNIRSMLDKLRFRMGQFERGERPEILGAALNADWRPFERFREMNRIRWSRFANSGEYVKVQPAPWKEGTWRAALAEQRGVEPVMGTVEGEKRFEEKWQQVLKALETDEAVVPGVVDDVKLPILEEESTPSEAENAAADSIPQIDGQAMERK